MLLIIFRNCSKHFDHSIAAHRVRVAFNKSFLEQVHIHAVNDDFKGRGIGPIGAAMRDRNKAGRLSAYRNRH